MQRLINLQNARRQDQKIMHFFSITAAMPDAAHRVFRTRPFLMLCPVIDRSLKRMAPRHVYERSVLSLNVMQLMHL